ncbi:hypothetical protein DFA_09108 [Cavenderia fasciculata]|uniref:Transmembrane protein n=1 Tax=Cavenderia fasciculata TaxID=261658 RepID=F4Q6Q1_CACFS|nr:uncharacterized protein DFA_09108 [Cavenderia fasciculata]EGG16561.1 hypothetical protein DFA_09108 [Cavenderia fasciculata]|eukprot:XP_004354961.1 hypothetical protein DFA_09108 [Cavenderia fasciculata]
MPPVISSPCLFVHQASKHQLIAQLIVVYCAMVGGVYTNYVGLSWLIHQSKAKRSSGGIIIVATTLYIVVSHYLLLFID